MDKGAGCPHDRCGHSRLVHVESTEPEGRGLRRTWGACAVCSSQARQGESGEHPCAGATRPINTA